MKLRCYALTDFPPKLAPARPQRTWMDEFTDRHAYRCLPLAIANAHGWEILSPAPIEVTWTGGPSVQDLAVRALKPLPGNRPLEHFCRSNFSRGIVTFHTDYIFRTDPGWDLLATGPLNSWKDNAGPLAGIIESDWLPYPFTMNWQVLRPGRVLFEEDEPFCFVFPVMKQALVDCEPEIYRLEDEPELAQQHEQFKTARDGFMKRLQAGDAAAVREAWQRYYFRGQHPDGTVVENHLNKLRLKAPVDRRAPRPDRPMPAASARPARRTDPRWEDASALNAMPLEQTASNEAGRRLLDRDGRLPRIDARLVASEAAAAGLDLLVRDDLLSGEECDLLCRTFHELESKLFTSDAIDPFWNSRILWFSDVHAARPEAARVMLEGLRRGIEATRRFYRLSEPIYPDLLQIVRWREGMFMPPHADNANPDGAPHAMAYRDLSGVVYLNDDYEGGHLYFTSLNVAVKPKRGMYVSMAGGFHHEHGVTRIERGTRLTLPFFLTFDRAKADSALVERLLQVPTD